MLSVGNRSTRVLEKCGLGNRLETRDRAMLRPGRTARSDAKLFQRAHSCLHKGMDEPTRRGFGSPRSLREDSVRAVTRTVEMSPSISDCVRQHRTGELRADVAQRDEIRSQRPFGEGQVAILAQDFQ